MTQRWKITIEYNGAPYSGWQRQDHVPSIQKTIEDAIYNYAGERVTVHCSGRTDAGVHALGQVAHFDLMRPDKPYVVRNAINAFLRQHTITILHATRVRPDFHARFDAKKRRYIYRLIMRPAPLTLDRGRVWKLHKQLDVEAMKKAARHFLGTHDFTSFRAAECQAESPIRSIERIRFYTDKDCTPLFRTAGELLFVVEARSFLHHQVRNMIGTLKEVGEGRRHPDDIQKILAARNRAAAGITAPPDGLYFAKVWY